MIKEKSLSELNQAQFLLSNWRFLPQSQIKMLITHLITSLDLIASYVTGKETLLEKAYLTLSSVRLFNNHGTENAFYNNYFHLKNLLRKEFQRLNPETVRIIGSKQVINADQEYFQSLINEVSQVITEAFDE